MISSELFQFIKSNQDADPTRLRLKYHGSDIPWMPLALNHLEALRKCGRKFGPLQPELIATPLSVEQATSSAVALLHGQIAQRLLQSVAKPALLDMTCGMGIDARALALALPQASLTAIEMQPDLAEVGRYNFRNDSNVTIECTDSVKWLADDGDTRFDLVFIDPARRDAAGRRVYNIHDCTPDVAEILPLIRSRADRLMVKLSPMLDVAQTLRDLPCSDLHIVDEGGECRELLAVLDFTRPAPEPDDVPVVIHSLQGNHPQGNYLQGTSLQDSHLQGNHLPGNSLPEVSLTFTRREEARSEVTYAMPHAGQWLFEPSAAAMKGAPFATLSARHYLSKLHPNTHLYVADASVVGLPGRFYRIEEVIPFTSSEARAFKRRRLQADVAVRNFPLSAADLAHRLSIVPSSTHRLLGATAADSTRLLLLLSK